MTTPATKIQSRRHLAALRDRQAHPLLTPEKAERLKQIEHDIELGRKEFHYKAGMGLAEIHQDKLYKKDYSTFSDYCRERWDITRSYAYELIDFYHLVENVRSSGQNRLPANAAQGRPLAKLAPKDQLKVWDLVVEYAGEDRITATLVEEVVAELHPPENHRPLNADSPQVVAVEEFLSVIGKGRAFAQALSRLNTSESVKYLDKPAALYLLGSFWAAHTVLHDMAAAQDIELKARNSDEFERLNSRGSTEIRKLLLAAYGDYQEVSN